MASETASRPSMRSLFHILFKRRKLILSFFSASIVVAFVALFVMKPTYRGTAQMLFRVGREDAPQPINERLFAAFNFNREEQINSEIRILRSRSLLEATLRDLGVAKVYPVFSTDENTPPIPGSDLDREIMDRAVLNLQSHLQQKPPRRTQSHPKRSDGTTGMESTILSQRTSAVGQKRLTGIGVLKLRSTRKTLHVTSVCTKLFLMARKTLGLTSCKPRTPSGKLNTPLWKMSLLGLRHL